MIILLTVTLIKKILLYKMSHFTEPHTDSKSKHCTKNHIFFFANILKRWSSQKNSTGIWSFLYHQEIWYFFSPKIWYYSLDGKWKMIFLKKKIHGNTIYSSNVPKRWSFQKKKKHWNKNFLIASGKMTFLFLENMIFFYERKMKHELSQKIHGNMMFSVCW